MNEPNSSQYILQSVSNALSVLDLLATHKSLSAVEVSREMNLGKTTAFRLLTTLEAHGYISKDAEAHYRLGMKLALMGDVVTRRSELAHLAHPYLEALRSEFQETVHLVGWYSATEAVVLDRVIGLSPISYYTSIGYINHPAHIAASGQVLLAFAEEQKLSNYFAKIDWTEKIPMAVPSIPDEETLRKVLAQVQKTGFASNNGDAVAGLYCYAVPIFDHTGHALASLSISGSEANLKSRQQTMIQSLRRTADQLQETFRIGLT